MATLLSLLFFTGFPLRETELALWSWGVHPIKLPIFFPFLDIHVTLHCKYHLLHDELQSWLFRFCVHLSRPFKQFISSGELHDDHSFTCSQLVNGNRYRSGIYCKKRFFFFSRFSQLKSIPCILSQFFFLCREFC